MKTYTIIGGVNGSGKSSLTGVLKSRMADLGVVVDVDMLTSKLGVSAVEGGKAAISIIADCMAKGIDFTQETTLSGFLVLRTAREAHERGYFVRMFYVAVNTQEECINRIKNRMEKGGHDVPADTVIRRFQNRFESLYRVLPYCNEATLFDNTNGFAQVAEYRNGELIPLVDTRPPWLTELICRMS